MVRASIADEISAESSDGTIGDAARGMVLGVELSLFLWCGIALALVWVGA